MILLSSTKKASEVMAFEWKTAFFQTLQKAVLLVSLSMLLYQNYLSFAEYNKHEYMQIQEEASLARVTLPMLVVCPKEPFASSASFMGYSEDKFEGWGTNNMTTNMFLESLLVEKQLEFEAFVSESLLSNDTKEKLEVKKLRITYYDGQCYSVVLPKNITLGRIKLVVYIQFPEEQQPKIFLYDPNTYNGYYNLEEPVSLDKNGVYQLFDVTLAKKVLDQQDPKVSCAHYDDQHTFFGCSSNEAEKMFSNLLGCVPPWFTDNQDKVCQDNDTERINEMVEGTLPSYFKAMMGKECRTCLSQHPQIPSWTPTSPSAPSPAHPSQ